MKRVRANAWCVTLLGTLAIIGCRLRYEQLELLSNDDADAVTNGGTATSGSSGAAAGVSALGDAGAGSSTEEGGAGGSDAVVGGMNGTGGGSDSGGTQSGTSGGDTGGTGIGGAGSGVCVADAACSCETFLGHEYRFCAVEGTRDAGAAACQAANMVLVRIDSAEENAWLLQQFTDHGMFLATRDALVLLGGSDSQVEGQWRWADGTLFWEGGPVDNLYTNFAEPPMIGQADCLVMFPDGRWGGRSENSRDATVPCESP